MPGALLVNGTVGAGKTAAADAAGDLLAEAGVPHAVIDVDWLRRSWPSPAGDPFNSAITLRNLAAVARNFLADGAERLVLAGVIESRDERDRYARALGVPLTVCWIRTGLATVRARLHRRHEHDDGLDWHLRRSGELDAVLEAAAVHDYTVDGTAGDPRAVAAAVLKGWP